MQFKKLRTVFSEVVEILETQPGVRNIELKQGESVTTSQLDSWERANRCSLPEDLKLFYLAHDGIILNWSYVCNNEVLKLGNIHVNSLARLKPLVQERESSKPSLVDLDIRDTEVWSPSFGGDDCRVFPLNYCSTCGHVCLIFQIPEGGAPPTSSCCSVWLLDLSLSWHFLCHTFSDYLRLAAVHLGLKQWPYAVTSVGLSPLYQKWFQLFVPRRFELDCSKSSPIPPQEETCNTLEAAKLMEYQPKGKLSKSSKISS